MRFRKRKFTEFELNPDEIFLDSSNLPEFNKNSLEGRLEKPLHGRAFLGMGVFIGLVFFALVAQAAKLEIMKGEAYALQSEKNRLRPEVIFAQRGAILDRNGVVLVSNKVAEDSSVSRTYETPGFSHLLGHASYPKKDASGHYYDTEIKGLAGVEYAFNDQLKGENGRLLVEEDARGKVQSQGTVLPAKNGTPVTLSIDSRAQKEFYTAIKELADRVSFIGGSGILMDATTGEIIALTSYPEYDSNVLSAGGPSEIIAQYATDKRQPYLDRAVSGLYTPGSVVKPIVASGVLTDKLISPEKTIFSSGSISVPNKYDASKPTIFRDWKALGAMDMRHAIAFSSDVYFYTVGGGFGGQKGLGIDRLKYWYEAFGFSKPTGIELSREASGFIPSPAWKQEKLNDPWRIGDTYNTSIGQFAMQISPMEEARAIAAIANGGKLVKPTILKGQPVSGESIPVDKDALQIVREGMRLGATEGTSIGLNDLSFVKVAGKTGTAQLGFNNEFHNSWAVGFFPYDKPRYVYVVVMERGPAKNVFGGVFVMHKFLTALHANAPEYFQ